MKRVRIATTCLALALILPACEDDDPVVPTDAGGERDTGLRDSGPDAPDVEMDAGPDDAGPDAALPDTGPPDAGPMCMPLTTDFDRSMTAIDGWAACATSDDGTYNTFAPSVSDISTVARVAAFENITALLGWETRVPTAGDFTDGRTAFTEAEGLGSRVIRRSDEHQSMGGTLTTGVCRSDTGGTPESQPDYCAGPQKIARVINEAFAAGQLDMDNVVNAARIEAALVWFLAISPFKEALTCTSTTADCDSAFAYYTGGMAPPMGLGLSRLVRGLSPEADSRAFDGILAMRCWRELDPAIPATDTALRDQARAQIDRAVLYGVAQIVKQHLRAIATTSGDVRRAHFEYARILGGGRLWPDAPDCGRCRGFLEYHVELVDAAAATALRTELDRTDPATVDIDAATGALDSVFLCP